MAGWAGGTHTPSHFQPYTSCFEYAEPVALTPGPPPRRCRPQDLPAVALAAAESAVADKTFHDALAAAAVRALPALPPGEVCRLVSHLAEVGAFSVAWKDALADHILAR